MKQKIFLTIAILSLLSLAVFVSAWTTEYGVPIYKGWNLVYSFMNPDQLEGQGFEAKNIKAVYGFLPDTQEYVRFYPNPDMNKINQMDGDQLRNTAFWVYSDSETGKEFNGIYNAIEYWLYENPIPYNERQIYKGWNFVGITSNMIGKNLNELKGNCNIEKSYAWWAKRQNWDLIDMNDAPFSQNVIGQGIVLKVTENCKLGTSSGTIPTVPNLP